MDKYNYERVVKKDLEEYIRQVVIENYEITSGDELMGFEDYVAENIFGADSVTGNFTGSYFCDAWKAEEAICHNWDLLKEACDTFGNELGELLERGPEVADVTIRCYMAIEVLHEVMEELAEELDSENVKEEEE